MMKLTAVLLSVCALLLVGCAEPGRGQLASLSGPSAVNTVAGHWAGTWTAVQPGTESPTTGDVTMDLTVEGNTVYGFYSSKFGTGSLQVELNGTNAPGHLKIGRGSSCQASGAISGTATLSQLHWTLPSVRNAVGPDCSWMTNSDLTLAR
jgi:hypothetical protein